MKRKMIIETERLFLREILNELGIPCVIAPPFYLGGVQALTRHFPGTFAFRKETIMACIEEYLENLDRFGFKRVVFFNDHGDTLLLQSILCEKHVTLLDVLQRVRGEYHKCQLGFTPALKDMDICVAEQYDGADDYRMFYLGKQLKRIEDENLYFPELSHA